MVESIIIDNIFTALADATRRNILERVSKAEMSIGEIAQYYSLTFAGVSKHIKVLERAGLITKRRRGKEQVVVIVPQAFTLAQQEIKRYSQIWGDRFDQLDNLLKDMED